MIQGTTMRANSKKLRLQLLKLVLFALAIVSPALAQSEAQHLSQNADSTAYINSEETAIAIGRAVLEERLGSQIVAHQEPLLAKLDDQGIWMVYGSPIKDSIIVGGGIFIKIRRTNGEILTFGALP